MKRVRSRLTLAQVGHNISDCYVTLIYLLAKTVPLSFLESLEMLEIWVVYINRSANIKMINKNAFLYSSVGNKASSICAVDLS